MAIYAGETVRVYADAQDWDDTPMSPADVTGVSVVITNKFGEVIVDGGEMVWSNDETRWLYVWDTPTEGGAYSVEVIFATPSGTSVDVRKVNLSNARGEKRRDASHFVRGSD